LLDRELRQTEHNAASLGGFERIIATDIFCRHTTAQLLSFAVFY
jgi:hypothetical protein